MKRSVRIVALALALLVSGFTAGYFAARRGTAEMTGQRQTPPALQIVTQSPERRNFQSRLPWRGEVISRQSVQVTAPESGRIVAVRVKDQEVVKKGDLLFTLGGTPLEGKLAVLREKVVALQRQHELAAATLKRKRQAATEKIVTLDALAAAEDEEAVLKSQAESAIVELATLERGTQVRAPAAGVFTGRTMAAGQEVSQGTVLAEVVDPAQLRIVATLFPPEGVDLTGGKAEISAGGGATLIGTVAGVLPAMTAEGGTQVWIEGGTIGSRLRPGATVDGAILLQTQIGMLALPPEAIVYNENEEPLVFVATPQGYRPQPVHVGQEEGGWVEILDGLNGDEKVVVRGAYELFYRNFNRTWREPD